MMYITLRRVRLNAGGYDNSGAYWGIGAPLYWYSYEHEGEEYSDYIRAGSRTRAKEIVRVILVEHLGIFTTLYRFYR